MKKIALLTAVLPIVLTGCLQKGIQDAGIDVPEPATVGESASAKDTIAARIADGKEETTLAVTNAVTITRDFNKSTVSNPANTNVTLKGAAGAKKGEVTLTLTASGKTTTFTTPPNANGEYIKTNADGSKVYLWNYTGNSWDDVAAGKTQYKYMIPIGTSTNANDKNAYERSYAVVGLKTPAQALKGKAKATYVGYAYADAYGNKEPSSSDRIRFKSDLKLDADFEKGTIKGSMTNLTLKTPGATSYTSIGNDKSFTINQTNISGNGFATDLTSEGPKNDKLTLTTSSFKGNFYGNKGQEAGGAWSFTSPEDKGGKSDSLVAAGVWQASEK